jgi:hypothetical protein
MGLLPTNAAWPSGVLGVGSSSSLTDSVGCGLGLLRHKPVASLSARLPFRVAGVKRFTEGPCCPGILKYVCHVPQE